MSQVAIAPESNSIPADFIGREQELKRMFDEIQAASERVPASIHVITIAGIGGIGKTRLVRTLLTRLSAFSISPTTVYIDLLEHEKSLQTLLDVQRMLARQLARALDASFNTFEAYCEQTDVEDLDSATRKRISECWVSDFEAAVRNCETGCAVVLDNYESIEFRAGVDGKRQDFCHAWISRIVACLRNVRLTLILSGRDIQTDTIEELGVPILKQPLIGFDWLAVKYILARAGVPLSMVLLNAVVESTGGHPLALGFLLDMWKQGDIAEQSRRWLKLLPRSSNVLDREETLASGEDLAAPVLKRILRYSWDSHFIAPERESSALRERLNLAALALFDLRKDCPSVDFLCPPSLPQVDALIADALLDLGHGAAPIRDSFPTLFEKTSLRPEVRMLMENCLETNSVPGVNAPALAAALVRAVERGEGGRTITDVGSLAARSPHLNSLLVTQIALSSWCNRVSLARQVICFFCRVLAERSADATQIARFFFAHPGFDFTEIARVIDSHLLKDPPNYIGFLREAERLGVEATLHKLLKALRRAFEYRLKDDRGARQRRSLHQPVITPETIASEVALFDSNERPLAREVFEQYLAARADLLNGIGDFSEAQALYEWLLTNSQGLLREERIGRVVMSLAKTYLRAKNWELIEKMVQTYSERFPSLKILADISEQKQAWRATTLARCREMLRRPVAESDLVSKSVELLKTVHALFPDCNDTLLLLARSLRRAGEAHTLDTVLQEIRRRSPASTRAFVTMGEVYLFNGEPTKAKGCFEAAERMLDKDTPLGQKVSANIVNHRAEIAAMEGDDLTARILFKERASLAEMRSEQYQKEELGELKRIEGALAKHALTKLGFVEFIDGRRDAARECFLQALDRDKDYLHATIGLALCDSGDGVDLKRAVVLCENKMASAVKTPLWKADLKHLNAFIFPGTEIGDFFSFLNEVGDITKVFFLLLRVECSVRVAPQNETLRHLRDILLQFMPFPPTGFRPA